MLPWFKFDPIPGQAVEEIGDVTSCVEHIIQDELRHSLCAGCAA